MKQENALPRRNLMTNFSGLATASVLLAVAARPALAQTMSSGNTSGTGYVKRTLMWGTFSKEMSQSALNQASNPKVTEFAHFEVDEQTTVAQVLTNESNPPPAPLTSTQQSQLAHLKSLTGKSFDSAYIQAQIQGHQMLLQIQQNYLGTSPTDRDHKHIAMLARTVINMHLTMLSDLNKMLTSS